MERKLYGEETIWRGNCMERNLYGEKTVLRGNWARKTTKEIKCSFLLWEVFLTEQFSMKKIRDRGYQDIYKKFLILNYTDFNQKDWCNKVRPFLKSADQCKRIGFHQLSA